jgi:hypothetical protein
VKPAEVDMVDVGSNETKSRRRIFHILAKFVPAFIAPNGVGKGRDRQLRPEKANFEVDFGAS